MPPLWDAARAGVVTSTSDPRTNFSGIRTPSMVPRHATTPKSPSPRTLGSKSSSPREGVPPHEQIQDHIEVVRQPLTEDQHASSGGFVCGSG